MPARYILEQDFSSIIEDSLNEIYIFDAITLKFLLVNKGARLNIGYSMRELRDMNPVDIKPEHTKSGFKKIIQPLNDHEQEKIEFNTIHQRKDGSLYPVEVHLQKRNFSDHPVFVAIILDISEREKIQSDLAMANAILESTPDAMIVVDSTGKIQLTNKQMSHLFGYSQSELLTMNVDNLVPNRFRKKHPQHRVDFKNKPRTREMGSDLDLSGLTKSGKEIPIEVSLSPIHVDSNSSTSKGLVAAAIRDITDRKITEKALLKSEENQREAREIAEKATHTKTRFLAAASHDLRQPLQALRLYLSALSTKIKDEKALNLAEKMHLSLDTMGDLLEALLDISSLESGNIQSNKQDTALLECINRVMTASSPQAQAKGLALESTVEEATIYSDPALLERILENFLTNAIRYTTTGKVSLHSKKTPQTIIITITDTGLGIPADELDTVFDEYYQVDGDIRGRNKGLGLGLSIVKHLARILEHPISSESVVGQGSSFSIELPLSSQRKKDLKGNTASIDKLEIFNPEVLIIDDDSAVLDAMTELMKTYDISVKSAENGPQALAMIEAGYVPDFVLSDYQMPDLTGIETVRKIREKLNTDVPVAIMTGDTITQQLQNTEIVSCTVMTKPVDVAELVALINSIKH